MSEDFQHYGVLRRSGRYPWGSGAKAYQRYSGFRNYVNELKSQGLSEKEIAQGLNMSVRELRATQSYARTEMRKEDHAKAQALKDKGYSNTAIGAKMGINESSVRSLLNPKSAANDISTDNVVKLLKSKMDAGEHIDVGLGTETYLGVSRNKLLNAIAVLEQQGYKQHYLKVEQLGTGKETNLIAMTKDDVPWKEVNANKENLSVVGSYTPAGGGLPQSIKPPVSIDSKRVQVVYSEDGGHKKDGVIEIRRGAEDLSMGNAKYMQVRIAVDGDRYLKGMAIYSDDLPPGVDVRFNTNKSKDVVKKDVLKEFKKDSDNPFGATVRQMEYTAKDGKKKQSAINIVNEEGDWSTWSKSLSSQVLSKQPVSLAKQQLSIMQKRKQDELDSILALTNPTVKQKLLQDFADGADGAATHLKAAALPRQASHVILPINSLKEGEVYAPGYRNGETVALVRYPHGGKFEIPQLKVNNSNKEGRSILANARDAIGINYKVANRLSGADFDGDTVLVIPNSNGLLKSSSPLKGLKNFDPSSAYPAQPGMKKMTKKNLQQEMGKISNLITDMTIRGANENELAAAVRHSMVVIDSEKHKLNYTKSATDNGIAALKAKYQGGANKGASTVISRASSKAVIDEVKRETVNPKTGEMVRTYSGREYTNTKGRLVTRKQNSTKMQETKDAFSLSSGTAMETVYAKHANSMKSLANQARKEMVNTKSIPYSASAKKTYSKEVDSLNSKLNLAIKNKPLERKAQAVANVLYDAKRQDNPNLDKDDLKRLRGQCLAQGRERVGAKKQTINITQGEWDAIQAGAITKSKLKSILDNADMDRVKELATPKTKITMTTAKKDRALQMLQNGSTQSEVADALGVSVSTLNKAFED